MTEPTPTLEDQVLAVSDAAILCGSRALAACNVLVPALNAAIDSLKGSQVMTRGQKLDIDRLVAAVNCIPTTCRDAAIEALKLHFPEIIWCWLDTGKLGVMVQHGYKP